MKRIDIKLTDTDRKQLHAFRSKGEHRAREVTRAHILAATDQGVGDEQIMQVLGVSRVVLWRTRAAYQEGGLNHALHDLPRAGAPRQYLPEQEAEVVALACEKPSSGRKRWTVRNLAEAARARPKLGRVSRETVRRWLKKTS
jgi:transposase